MLENEFIDAIEVTVHESLPINRKHLQFFRCSEKDFNYIFLEKNFSDVEGLRAFELSESFTDF